MPDRNESIELVESRGDSARNTQTLSGHDDAFPHRAVDLPPTDTGFAAYSYLFANFVIQFLAWSYAFSYAVFLPYYRDVLFRDHANISLLSLIGTLATGIMYVNALVVMRICPRYPWIKRPMMLAGLLTATLALVGAAFATEPWQLVLTQGVMFSVGGSFLYYPASSLLMEWFVKRRGLANGIIFSGTGIGGVVVPFMVNSLLHKYGKRTTFLVMAAVMCGCTLPVLPLLKPRLPDRSASARQAAKINYSVFKSIPLWCLIVSNWMQSMGHSIPLLWLPTFASDMHLSGLSGVLVIALLNGASVPGRIFMGYCSDHYDLRIPMLLTSVAPALGVLFLWGFTSNLALLVVFAIYHGFLGGGFSSMWPRFVSSVAKDDPHTSSFLLATFYAGRGVAYIVSTPVSTGLLSSKASLGSGNRHIAYEMQGYGPVIFVTGLLLLVSGLGVSYRSLDKANRHSHLRSR